MAVLPITKAEWSEDGETLTATLASSLVDEVAYQVSYEDSNVVAFTASVGKVASIVILTASAEQNVKTPIEFALYDENLVNITSTIDVDTDVTVAVEGVSGAIVTADTSKPSAAAVTMTKVNDVAKVTVTYTKDDKIKPAEGKVICTSPTATIGNARFKRGATNGTKTYSDGTECARFYVGTDATQITVPVGSTLDDVFFCVEDLDAAGTIISYDNYEVSSSNDDVMSTAIEAGVDAGKFAQINVSGNTVGEANILVKATKNGADYTYIIPVKVIPESKLVSITASANRPTISNAIDFAYSGSVTITGKWSDGTTDELSAAEVTSEIVDADKKTGLSANLLAAMDLTTNGGNGDKKVDPAEETAARARFADDFDLVGLNYYAWGSKAGSYTLHFATTNEDGKELTARTTVQVKDLPVAAWDMTGTGAKMEYSMEFSNGATLDEKKAGTTTANLAAYTNKLFAGFVRDTDNDGSVTIATGVYTPAVEAEAGAFYLESAAGTSGSDGYVKLTEKVPSDTTFTITYAKNGAKPVEAVAGTNGTATGAGLKFTIPTNTTDEASAVNGLQILVGKTGATTGYDATSKTLTIADTATTASAIQTAVRGATVAGVTLTNATVEDAVTTSPVTLTPDATGTTVSISGFVKKVTAVPDGWAASETAGALTLTTYSDSTATEIVNKINGTTTPGSIGALFTASKITKAEFDALSPAVTLTGGVSAYQQGNTYVPEQENSGNAKATAATTIKDVYRAIKFGATYSYTGEVYGRIMGVTPWAEKPTSPADVDGAGNGVAYTWITLDPVNNVTGPELLVNNTKYDWYYAQPGSYTVTFFYTVDPTGTAKDAQASSTVTVSNSLVAPKVTVNKRNLDNLTADDIKDAISINCDMNSNVSSGDSFTGDVYVNNNTTIIAPSTADSDKWLATYLAVDEAGVTFIVPVNTTFTSK